ncbi:coordinator of PRMT5 and differentiation stimulator isoform X1 [Rhinatrema bivittatum]|uniref:coordinator of PRMT5 and differentiation stimulator isoform X1 n=1 Tax=Rhinatrema bivittatum TaxID=194408 RepID=UPI00112C0650|nr:coordinator of PRMT5 and differentiation stimulator isoform X1 [Rhinatrema bivittatum]
MSLMAATVASASSSAVAAAPTTPMDVHVQQRLLASGGLAVATECKGQSEQKASFSGNNAMKWRPQREYVQNKVQGDTECSFYQPENTGSLSCETGSAEDKSDCDTCLNTSSDGDWEEDFDEHPDADDDLDVEFGAFGNACGFVANMRINTEYEKEDWDKELDADDPYARGHIPHVWTGLLGLKEKKLMDSEDIDITFQQEGLVASSAEAENSMYIPSWHHAAPLTTTSPVLAFETGQFEDVDT